MTRRRMLLATAFAVSAVFLIATATFHMLSSGTSNTKEPPGSALERSHSHAIGPEDARVSIVEFFSPSCSTCAFIHPYVKEIVDRAPEDIRLVYRYVVFDEQGEYAARIIESARSQGLYDAVLAAVLETQPEWRQDPAMAAAWRAAEMAGLDIDKAKGELYSESINETLRTDLEDARNLDIHATPSFFVNGRPLAALSVEALQALVQTELEDAASRR